MNQPDNHAPQDRYSGDDTSPFDVQDYSDRRSMTLLLISLGIVLLIAIVAFKLYFNGVRDRDAPPVISQASTPIKVAPEDPGGEVTPDQDKAIYDVKNGSIDEGAIIPSDLPEKPIDLPSSANIILGTDTTPVSPNEAAPVATVPKPQPKPAAKNSPPQTQSVAPQTATRSVHVVQVASVRTEDQARSVWNDIKARHGTILPTRANSSIVRADLGERGIYYRLKIVGLGDKAEATRLCNALKSRGQACFVTT